MCERGSRLLSQTDYAVGVRDGAYCPLVFSGDACTFCRTGLDEEPEARSINGNANKQKGTVSGSSTCFTIIDDEDRIEDAQNRSNDTITHEAAINSCSTDGSKTGNKDMKRDPKFRLMYL